MGYGFQYDRTGTKCSGRGQTGTAALVKGCLERWPALTNLGVYNCRPVRGGTSLSLHGEGRAGDLGSTDKALHDEVFAALIAAAEDLGIQEVISWERRWDSISRQVKPYDGKSLHKDHVHVGQCWAAAKSVTTQQVRAALAGEEEDDMAAWSDEEVHALLTYEHANNTAIGEMRTALLELVDIVKGQAADIKKLADK